MANQTTKDKFVDVITSPTSIAIASIGIAGATIFALRRSGTPTLGSASISTEQAVSAFSILAGIGGAASQFIASNRLSAVQRDEVSAGELAVPILISIAGSAGAAFLLPSG